MKKLFAIMLCAMLIFAMPIFASAEADSPDAIEQESVTEKIVDYAKENVDKIVVIIVMVGYSIVESRIRGKMNGSIGTLNNNAIAVAESSAKAIKAALSEFDDIANVVKGYKEEFMTLLVEIRKSAEEKKSLEDTLKHVETFLKTAKLATLELSNEVAELLVLANIPNSKKEELYARHTKAVHEIEAAEEVTSNDGSEE